MNRPPASRHALALRQLTSARVGLDRIGTAQSTADVLRFQHDHARARDAVHLPLDVRRLREDLQQLELRALTAATQAPDRATYLRRPDAGRRLLSADVQRVAGAQTADGFDVALVLADGLSSAAMQQQPLPFLRSWLPLIHARGWQLGPPVIVEQGRVAVGDEVGELLGARCVVVLIGERPGLSAADSMGIYMTHAPHIGRTDAQRNCISNVRAGGLAHADAAHTLTWLIEGARRLGRSGVDLKDNTVTIGNEPANNLQLQPPQPPEAG